MIPIYIFDEETGAAVDVQTIVDTLADAEEYIENNEAPIGFYFAY